MEEDSDLISNLPSEILRRFISFLPLREAVRTSFLSTTWRSLWKPLHVNLEFDLNKIACHEVLRKEIVQLLGAFISSYDAFEQWKFLISQTESSKNMNALNFTATKGEKELHLDFLDKLLVRNYFNLKLEPFLGFEKNSFCSLKTLHLRSVNHVFKKFVFDLFSSCWCLENLKLEKCEGLKDFAIKSNEFLQSLTIVDCPNIFEIAISVPNLKSFYYRGVLPKIQMNYCSNLVDVVLDMCANSCCNNFNCEELLSLLASLKEVEILTISGWLLEWLCAAGVIFKRLEFRLNNLKELRLFDSSIDAAKRDSLACFLNITPSLQKLFIEVDQSRHSVKRPFFHHYWHDCHLWMDQSMVKSSANQLEQLKFVEFTGFTHKRDQLLLLDLLLTTAVSLESMIITSPRNLLWRAVKIPTSQPKHVCSVNPKAASNSFEMDYFWGFTRADSSGRCVANARPL